MTSPSKASLAAAVELLDECERFLENPYAQERHWELVELRNRVQDFMENNHVSGGGQHDR